jgi:hypothetical protein
MNDIVCIFHSARTPFILRPGKMRDTCTLMGPAYVHRVMYSGAEPLNLKAAEFALV